MKTISIFFCIFIIHYAAISKSISFEKDKATSINASDELFLYKKAINSENDEYKEGNIYVYDTKKEKSFLLFPNTILDRTEAWISNQKQFVVLSMNGISLFDKNKKKIEDFYFKPDEIVLGGCFDQMENIAYFLLKNNSENQIDLCKFRMDNYELKKIKKNLEISYEGIEAPFKKMLITNNRKLLIENNCKNFMSISLNNELSLDNILLQERNCSGGELALNKSGIVFMNYKDLARASYQIFLYEMVSGNVQNLMNGKNRIPEQVLVSILCNPEITPFIVKMDSKYFYYDFSSFNEIKMESGATIIKYLPGEVFCLNKEGGVTRIKLK